MGALVAFALAAARIRNGGAPPRKLYVGAYAAPHLTPPLPPADAYEDGELARFLVGIGGLDPRFLGRDDWLRALLPIVRDDLRICASHREAGLPVGLPLDVHAFTGEDDRLVDPGAVRSWERYARRFALSTVPGGHFFPRERPEPFFDVLNDSLNALVAGERNPEPHQGPHQEPHEGPG
jgi:surfactin synthase thioesterase subunit